MKKAKKPSACVFREENSAGIDEAPQHSRKMGDLSVNGCNDGGAAVNREHKQGCFSHHGRLS